MVLKEVPGWARKCIVIGLLLPIIAFFMIKDYNPSLGIVNNVTQVSIAIPFMWGQNPVVCLREDVQRLINGSLGFGGRVMTSYECTSNTEVPYRFILCLGLFMIVLGVYMFAKGQQMANIWPTEWKPFDEANVRKKNSPSLKLESPDDKPISPRDGGF